MKKIILLFAGIFILSYSCSNGGGSSSSDGGGGGTTPDTTAPTLSSSVPTDTATGIATNANISLTFSEKMSGVSVTSDTSCTGSVQLSKDDFNTCVAGAITSSDDITYEFNPSADFDASTEYKVKILSDAKDAAGNTMTEKIISFTTGAGADTTAPTAGNSGTIAVDSKTHETINISWTKATDNVSAETALQYLIYTSASDNIDTVSNAESNGTAVGSYAADINTKSITSLSASTTYYFNVIVKDEAGNKAVYTTGSETTDAAPADGTAPTPGNSGTIAVDSKTHETINISWTKATDNVSAETALQYLVYTSSSNNIDTVANAEANGTAVGSYAADINTKSITSLSASTTYYFNVIVKDEAGNKAVYTTKTETTSASGDTASLRDVVINEINWFGSDSTADEWIELYNTTGSDIDLTGWGIENAGTSGTKLMIDNGTIIAANSYLVIANQQGGANDSVTGVSGVQIDTNVSLSNSGVQLILKDSADNTIDSTPSGAWAAGDSSNKYTMERKDSTTGGGYTDGTLSSSWYTWNSTAGSDTTNSSSSDSGTPGAANSNPNAGTLYSTDLESGNPQFEKVDGAGTWSNSPPNSVSARSGTQVFTNSTITTAYTARSMQSADCIALTNDSDTVRSSIWATADPANGGNEIRARIVILWFTDSGCSTAHGTPDNSGTGIVLSESNTTYTEVTYDVTPPSGATHIKIKLEVKDNNGGTNSGDDWAADDVRVQQY